VKAKVAQIDFIGNQRFSDGKLRSQMKEVKKHNLITWVRKKNLYIPSKLDEDLEHIKNFYQDYGYQKVSFGDPQVVTANKRVKVTIPVKEGEIHTFGDVSVEGNTVFTSDQIIGNWPLKKGDVLARADAGAPRRVRRGVRMRLYLRVRRSGASTAEQRHRCEGARVRGRSVPPRRLEFWQQHDQGQGPPPRDLPRKARSWT
jgi:hypothetical protein